MTTTSKAKAMEVEIQEIKLKRFKERMDFDYRGMKDKIKRAFTHVHHLEYIWIDLQTKDIYKMDYCRLTVEQNIDLNLTLIIEGVIDDGQISDPEYEEQWVVDASILQYSGLIKNQVLFLTDFNQSWKILILGSRV